MQLIPMPASNNDTSLLYVLVDRSLNVDVYISATIVYFILLVVGAILLISIVRHLTGIRRAFEIDETEFGIGNQKMRLKPNTLDQQVAYQIWVELSTRKIGLPIDLDNDVIAEIYDSWYNYFSVTRELIKDIPVSKVKKKSTQKIIHLSIEVLNSGLRPHLTMWQARFRRWYARKLDAKEYIDHAPQDIQKEFPHYEEMTKDMLELNKKLEKYRKRMYELVTGQKEETFA